MSQTANTMIAVIGIDIGKNSFHVVGHDARGAIVLRQKWAEAIAEVVQRPTMKFVATKTAEQLDLQALHRVRERLVSQRTGIINQIRAFMLERGIAVRQGIGFPQKNYPFAAPSQNFKSHLCKPSRPVGPETASASFRPNPAYRSNAAPERPTGCNSQQAQS